MLEFSIVSYTLLLFSYVYIECKWADLFPSPYFPTCRSVVAFPLLNIVLISPLAVPLVLCHSRALLDASFNMVWVAESEPRPTPGDPVDPYPSTQWVFKPITFTSYGRLQLQLQL